MPRFTDKTIDSIRSRVTISDVMQNYAFIENKGGSKWVKCPFHGGGNERTPSCKLDDTRGTFYCFGCHESGDIFSLVMKKEGVDFSSAVEMLAKKAGVELEEVSSPYNKDEAKKRREEKENLYDLYSRLSNAFHYLLLNSKEGEGAREYLKKRNVSEEMIETFQLGYAPLSKDWLYSFLSNKGYSDAFLKQSGLFSQKSDKWPLFRGRLMFPIRDRQGRTIAFSGRDLTGDERSPKYINSPETTIYQKKENYFGLYEAKNTISEGKMGPILCEGNFDVVAMHQAGYKSAVASLGTSFTNEQCANMKKWYPNNQIFNILYDSDAAGQKSTERALLILNRNGFEQRVHKLTTAKDASELLERDGEEGVKNEFEPYVSGFDYLVQSNLNRYDIKTARGKVDFLKSLSEYLAGCSSEVERDSYILSLSSLLGVSDETIKEDLNKARTTQRSVEGGNEEAENKERERAISIDLFAMLYLANHRSVFRVYRSKLSFGDLEDRDAQKLYMAIENAMRDGVESNELFLTYLDDSDLRSLVSTSFALDEYGKVQDGALDEAIDRIRLRSMERKRDVLTTQLKLSTTLDPDEVQDLLERKVKLDKLIKELRSKLLLVKVNSEE
ncbi:MAG: DNA primase [Spirochaetales bacterium]|nr:DNA primase [Spirochaetales bacterium]